MERPLLRRSVFRRILVLTACVVACGVADAIELGNEELEITFDTTYVSRHIWHGYDLLPDNTGALQPDLTLSIRGFSIGVWGSQAMESGYESLDELDYYFGYARTVREEKRFSLDLWATYTYFDFYKSDSKAGDDGVADVQEISFGVSLPSAIKLGESFLVPSYSAYYEFAGKDAHGDIDNGWMHVLGLAYDLPLGAKEKGDDRYALSFMWDLTYNDGVFGSDSGWSHTTIGTSTTFTWKHFYLTPALYYQWSFEDTVNSEDEAYLTISTGVVF